MTAAAEGYRVRLLEPGDAGTFATVARLEVDAYPVMRVEGAEGIARFAARLESIAGDPGVRVAVAEGDGAIAGAMLLYDFTMRVRERDAFAGGLGSVAVGLAHKRRGVARTMVRWYLEDFRARGAAFAVLHPFRPDFYRALGFGYGTPVRRYRFAPATLDARGARGTVRLLDPRDRDALIACDERVRARTNGLIAKAPARVDRLLAEPALRHAGVEEDGVLRGFVQTAVRLGADGTANANELLVRELAAESPAYEAALLGYLRSQQDQFARIVVESQDDALWLASADPRDGSDVLVAAPATHRVAELGLGVMYRVLDLERAFAHLGASAAPFALRVDSEDAFFPPTAAAPTFRFGPGGPPVRDDAARPDATLRAGIAELSSLLAGSLRLRDVLARRLAELEPLDALAHVARVLDAPSPPICTTRF